MLTITTIERLTRYLNLTPYQAYMLQKNGHKYDMRRLAKRGTVLYAPYKCLLTRGFRDRVQKVFFGPRVDLIGADRVLVRDRRGVKLYPSGFYHADDFFGQRYYADPEGRRTHGKNPYDII